MGTGHPHRPGTRSRWCCAGDLPTYDRTARARPWAREAQLAIRMAYDSGHDCGCRHWFAVRSFRRCSGLRRSDRVARPVEWLIRRRLLGTTVRIQITTLVPSVHVAIWVCAGYMLIATTLPERPLTVLTLGTVMSFCTGAVVLRLAHRALLAELVHMANRVVGRGRR